MKKITLTIASVALLSFASCKKERTCTCSLTVTEVETLNDNGDIDIETSSYTVNAIYKMDKISKVGAQGACINEKRVDKESQDIGGGISYTYETTTDSDCKLD